MSPEDIRALRGDLSREGFAEEIGVTPLTVYRWELPVDEKESRRPQRRLLTRLREFGESGESQEPGDLSTPIIMPRPRTSLTESPEVSLKFYDEIFGARWGAAESQVLATLSSPQSDSSVWLSAQIAQAMLKVLWRNDLQGAWALVAPALQHPDLANWPASLVAPLHTVAALLHASPDGRLFSPGRVNAHVAHAERVMGGEFPEFRALLRVAEMWAAFHLGDAGLHEQLRRKSQDDFRLSTSVVVKWAAWEVGSISAHLSGCIVDSIRFFQELVTAARREGLPVVEMRGSGYLAWMMLTGAESLDDIEAYLLSAQKSALMNRVEPGWPSVLLLSAEAEIACRKCEFDKAADLIELGLNEARRSKWAPIELAYTDVRVAYLRDEMVEPRQIEERYGAYEGGYRAPLSRVVGAFAEGIAALSSRDPRKATVAFLRAADTEQEIGTMPIYETYSLSLAYYTAVLSGDLDSARLLLRRAERALERMPMFWCSSALRLFKALHAALEGRVTEAFQHADAAEAAFMRVGDRAQWLLASRLRAMCAVLLDESDAEEQLLESSILMEEAGIAVPAPYRLDAIELLKHRMQEHESTALVESGGLSVIAQATNRLSTRGISPSQVLDELVDLLLQWRNLFVGHSIIWLDELPQQGKPIAIRHSSDLEPTEFLEFGDGAGRRYRVGVGGTLMPDERTVLQMMVQMASMALEVVMLRGLTNPASSSVTDHVPNLPGFIAASTASRDLLKDVVRVAKSRANVLLLGESGVGKEMVAHAVYKSSPRSNRAFITFNCAAIPRELFEGQLFGYRKGAFTGATSNHPGVLRAADGGTLFLDEVGDLPLDLQPKLLRFLENGEVFPLGETRPLKVDVRVIAATHRNLEAMVADGTFREDLYYRLAVVPILIRPLRERREDILVLAQHFLKNLAEDSPGLTGEAGRLLVEHSWPGNVRELRNVIERTLAYVQDGEMIRAEDLKF
jgi:hypothetical protein